MYKIEKLLNQQQEINAAIEADKSIGRLEALTNV